ncbi:MAG: T9SS type A sorting domain-containing protein [Ignavibacteria bacterium]|jgi:hypothetical protein|nr:T9SS type A sorting domain-containing protein [Ignavibacteria bacterium]
MPLNKLNQEVDSLRIKNDGFQSQLDYLLKRIANCCPDTLDYKKDIDTMVWKDTTGRKEKDTAIWIDKDTTGWKDNRDTVIWKDTTGKGKLFNNIPNPFTEITKIYYYIPQNAGNAFIAIYTIEGSKLMEFDVSKHKGSSSITINGGQLKQGIYIYSLTIDGKEVDSKQMILTR